jgi:hypothetical protein
MEWRTSSLGLWPCRRAVDSRNGLGWGGEDRGPLRGRLSARLMRACLSRGSARHHTGE